MEALANFLIWFLVAWTVAAIVFSLSVFVFKMPDLGKENGDEKEQIEKYLAL